MKQRKQYKYLPVSVPDAIRARVEALATEHRRSLAQEGGALLELGLKAYEAKQDPKDAA